MLRLLPVLLALLCGGPALADQLFDFATSLPLPPLSDIVVHGTNTAAEPRLLIIRIDDMIDPDYAHRVNEERYVRPGRFSLRLRLSALRTIRGRALETASLRRAIAFAPDGGIAIDPIQLEQPPALPQGTFGWFFGPAEAVPLAGFQAVALADPALSGPALRQVHRPSQDPVLAWGTRFTRFEGHLPPGKWHLTMWTEDPGEWELLPMVLERRIRINGADIVLERRGEAEWVAQRYFAGRKLEADPDLPPFAALGARRGGRVEADVLLPDGHFSLELAGYPQASTNMSMLTASPFETPDAAGAAVEAVRAARFAEMWPVIEGPHPEVAKSFGIDGESAVTAAPGGMAIFRLIVHSPETATALAALDGGGAGSQLLWGMWRWRRPAPDIDGLIYSAAHLRADSDHIPLRAGLPRPLTVVVPVPPDAKPGKRMLSVVLVTDHTMVERKLRIDVLPVRRPGPVARVGAFLDFAPHLTYDMVAARRQAECDLDTLRGLGLTAVAPPLANPAGDMAPFLNDLAAAAARFAPPIIAYAPARRLANEAGMPSAGAMIARADVAAKAAGLPPPVWTVADEPTGSGTSELATGLAQAVHKASLLSKVAAHLNDPGDAKLLPSFDLVTVNPRYGADAAEIAALRAAGHQPWLYNMPHARLAAGFYLWRSGADGLLQWHARMPTADAFDPTDGREGDVQFLWPTPGVCTPPDLDADLLDLVDGQEDLRWMAWLEAAAKAQKPGAVALLAQLRQEIPDSWRAAAALPEIAPAKWRERILSVAKNAGG